MPSFDTDQTSLQKLMKLHAERTTHFYYFVGSGLSRDAGIPDWSGLRQHLNVIAEKKSNALPVAARTAKLEKLRKIAEISDPWEAFSELREELGATTFRTEISDILSTTGKAPPENYNRIWRLPNLRGIVTLNLDKFALATCPEYSIPIHKNNIGTQTQKLKALDTRIVAHLHGIVDDPTTWILTKNDLSNLQASRPYQNFLGAIFTSATVVFIGITAVDAGAGGMLQRLVKSKISSGPHFWITGNSDETSDRWAEDNDVLVIRYPNDSNPTSSVASILDTLRTAQSFDSNIHPITSSRIPIITTISTPSELEQLPYEEVRHQLNGFAKSLRASDGNIDEKQYGSFIKEYFGAISRAATITEFEPYNDFFGYKLIERLGAGLFGQVYKAVSRDNLVRAIKIFHANALRDPIMLNCFRRGATSMKMLTNANTSGTVKFVDAFEFPPAIVMEFIPGETLEAIISRRTEMDWIQALEIGAAVAGILASSHKSNVLHRDVRPANIMINRTESGVEVTVLDFDLSWHIGARGQSMGPRAFQAAAYLSPEQNTEEREKRTRNALVDSYCYAMTLYSLFTRDNPGFGDNRDQEWEANIKRKFKLSAPSTWHSAPARLARLIATATRADQNLRPTMDKIHSELINLKHACSDDLGLLPAEMPAEEIISRTFGSGYFRSIDEQGRPAFVHNGARGIVYKLIGDEAREFVFCRIEFAADQTHNRSQIIKFVSTKLPAAVRALQDAGWQQNFYNSGGSSFSVEYTSRSPSEQKAVQSLFSGLKKCSELLSIR